MSEIDNDIEQPERRDFLEKATIAVGSVGVACTAWPFIDSMNPSASVTSKATTELDLTGIAPGESKTVEWQGKPVFVLHRSAEQVKAMQASQGGKDPAPDTQRVINKEWLVVIGVCTHLGCVPNRDKQGWMCPCHGSAYDDSGRILHGPAPRNLDLPPYMFITNNKIVIGKSEEST